MVCIFVLFIWFICDRKNENFDGYNIGFFYINGENDKVWGYELWGYGGYKFKVVGSDFSFFVWVVDFFGGNQQVVRNVFFCELVFDVMVFY